MNELAATNTAQNSLNSTRLSGWGNYPKLDCRVYFQRRIEDLQELLGTASSSLIARGLGRSYGDSAVNSDGVLLQRTRDRFLSFDVDSGLRYKKNNNLPEVPSFEKYKEHLLEIINKMGLSSNFAICTLPPIGENKDSGVNQHVNKFNDYIKFVADDKNLSLLPVSESLWFEIQSRKYQLKSDYNANSFQLSRRIFGGIFHHYLLKQSWNDIAKAKGQWILFDQIHLNERGAEIVLSLIHI